MEITMDLVRDIQSYMDDDIYYYKNDIKKENKQSKHYDKRLENLRDIKKFPRITKYADSFECPEHLRGKLQELIEKSEKGDSLRDHLSKDYNNARKQDQMFNHWSIRHLHLHIHPQKNDLLFCIITDEVLYAIFIGVHRQWENEEFYKIACRNWPEQFDERYGVTPEKITAKQLKILEAKESMY